MDPLFRGEDPDLELFTKNIQPQLKSSGNAARSWQWRERGLNPRHAAINKRVLEDAAEDHLVYKEKHEERAYDLPGHPRSTFLMVFSPDGTKVASTHGNHTVYVSDVASGKHVRTLQGHPRTPWCIAFHPSHTQIIGSGCLGGQVRVWDLSGGSEVWAVGSVTVIASIAFHPRDQLLVIATHNELYFWDWSQPQPFTKICTNNINEKVRYVSFDPMGHKLITGISIWPSPEPMRNVVRVFTSAPAPSPAPAAHRTADGLLAPPALNTNGLSTAHLQMVTSYQSLVQRYDTLVRNYHRLFLASQSTNTTDRGTDPMENDTESSPSSSRSPLIGANPLIGGAARHAPARTLGYTSTEPSTPPPPPHNSMHNQSHYRHISWYDGLSSNRRRRSNRLFDRDEGIIPRQLQGADPETRHQFILVLDRLQSYMENSIEETLEFWKRYDEASRTLEEPNGQPSSSRPDTSRPPHPRAQSLENVEQRSMLREFLARRHAARVAERNRSNNNNDNSDVSHLPMPSVAPRCPRYRHFSATAARERYRLDRMANSDRSNETIARWLQLIRNILQNSGRSLRTLVNQLPDSQIESSILLGQHTDLYRYLSVIERSEAELHREHIISSSDSDSSDHVQILRTRNRSVISDQQSNISTNDLELEDTQEIAENRNDDNQVRVGEEQVNVLPEVPSVTPLFDGHSLVNYRLALRKIKLSIDALHKHMESLSALWAVNTPHPTLSQIRSLWENLHREIISLFRSPTGDTNSSYFTQPLSARCRMLNTTNGNSLNPQRVTSEEGVSAAPPLVTSQQMDARADSNNLASANCPRDNIENTSSESSQSSLDSSSTETDNDNSLPSTSSGITTRISSRKRRNQTTSSTRRRITSARTKTPIELASRLRTPSSNYNSRTDQDFRQMMRSTTSAVIGHSQRNTQPSQTTSPNPHVESEPSGPNAELNITRHGVRFCARRLINIIVNVMMDCLEDEDLGNQLTIILRILKKSLGVTCLLLMSENIITQGRREAANEPQPSTSGASRSVGPARSHAPTGPFVRQARLPFSSPEDTLLNSPQINLRDRRDSPDKQTPSTSRAVQRSTRDRSDSSKVTLRHCTSQRTVAERIHRQTSGNETQQPPTYETSSQTTDSKNSTKRSRNSLSSPVPLSSPEVAPGPSTSWRLGTSGPGTFDGSEAAELSDRIAVQISAVNKNNSNIAQYRRDLYNQRRLQIALQRYNPLSGRPNPPRHRRDSRDRTHIRSRHSSANRPSSIIHRRPRARNSNLELDLEAVEQNEEPDSNIPVSTSGPIDELARLAGIQARLRGTPRMSGYRLRLHSTPRHIRRESLIDADAGHSHSADTESERRWGTGELESVLRHVSVPLVQVNNVPLVHVNDVPLGEVAMAEAQAQPHDFVQPIIVAQNAMMLDEEEMPTHGVLEPGARIVSDPLTSPVHRVQAWDFTNGAIPDITDATKNVVVQKCKIHNDASIDISKDGRMLVALLPAQRIRHVTHRLGVYSLEWNSLGVCLYSSLLEQNAVSVALSPSARYLAVGLGSRRVTFLPSARSRAMAVVFKLTPQTNNEHRSGRGELIAARVLEQIWESGFTSLNCFRWAPAPGQGFVYANNTGQLKILS